MMYVIEHGLGTIERGSSVIEQKPCIIEPISSSIEQKPFDREPKPSTFVPFLLIRVLGLRVRSMVRMSSVSVNADGIVTPQEKHDVRGFYLDLHPIRQGEAGAFLQPKYNLFSGCKIC
jgi:hypothetical protein